MNNAYMDRKACSEIIKFISMDKRISNITKQLNNSVLHYYSILCDG